MGIMWKEGSKEGASLTLPSTLQAGYSYYYTQSLTVRAISGMEYICKNNDLYSGVLLLLYEQGLADVHQQWPELILHKGFD